MKSNKPVALDFTDADTAHALEFIKLLVDQNRVAGMIFALSMRHDRKHPHLCGATGRLAHNYVEGAGLSGMLQLKLTQEALDQALGTKR